MARESNYPLKKGLLLYRYLVLKSIKNKIKNLSLPSILLSLLLLAFSSYFFVKTIGKGIRHSFVYNVGEEVFPSPLFLWLAFVYIFLRLIDVSRIGLSGSDILFYKINPFKSKSINAFFFYDFLGNITNFWVPLFVGFSYYLVLHNLKIGLGVFFSLYLLNCFFHLLKFTLFFASLNPLFLNFFSIGLGITSAALFFLKVNPPTFLFKMFYPIVFGVSILFNPQNYPFLNGYPSLLFFLLLIFLLLWDLYLLDKKEIHTIFEKVRGGARSGVLERFSLKSFPRVNKEIKKMLNEMRTFGILMAVLVTFGFSDLFFYEFFVKKNSVPAISKGLLLLIIPAVTLPTYFFIKAPHYERKNLWIYKLSPMGVVSFFDFYFLFYWGIFFIFSLLVLLNVGIFSLLFPLKIFSVKLLGGFLIHAILIPVVPILVAFLIGARMGNLLSRRGILPILYIGFVWIFTYLLYPYIFLTKMFSPMGIPLGCMAYDVILYFSFRIFIKRIKVFKEEI